MLDIMKIRIFRSSQRVFECQDLESKKTLKATAHGNLLKSGDLVVGDIVEAELDQASNQYKIVARCERENTLFRYISRERKNKTIAANIDFAAIVCSFEKPIFKRGLIDRYLLRIKQWGCSPLVIFNKEDIALDKSLKSIEFEKKVLDFLEVPCFCLSAHSPDNCSDQVENLKRIIKDKSLIMLGQSGVGKSSLISMLSDGKVDLKTKEIGKVGKGTHTTTWSEIIDCSNFLLVDSPGIRSFSLNDLLESEVKELFSDLDPYLSQCKFNDCQHNKNSVGCFFQQTDDPIILARFESYLRFIDEVSFEKDWLKKKNRG